MLILASQASEVVCLNSSHNSSSDNLFPGEDVDTRAPISVKYEIPYFTVSGIQVRYLKIVEKSGYQALPWVRYITKNGDDYRHGVSSLVTCMS